jgi:succinate dehydrogenase / fumarate reductase cytochrome b subunit
MSNKTSMLSSIGQKLLLATSGLIMFLLFLIPHMGGNILFLFGPELFNSYAYHLHTLVPIVIGIEVLMLISITVHMFLGIRVALANKKAASTRHSQKSSEKRSFAARMMPISGLMIFIFIIKHLLDFTFTHKNEVYVGDHIGHDVYEMVFYRFQDPVHVAFYLLFMVAVGLHLSHALQSAMQTFGVYVPREGSKIKIASTLIAILMAGTFAIIPIIAFIR